MKKILVFSLVIIIILTMATSVYAASGDNQYLTRASAVQKIVRALYTTDKTTDFAFDLNYCVHENGYAHFVPIDPEKGYPILCEIYDSVEGSGFSDVSTVNDDTIFITLAKAMKIINGNVDGTFAPDNFTTYNQAVKMIICTIGYGELLANEKGGYPDGYIAVANDFGITDGMIFQGDDRVSPEDLALMLDRRIKMKYSPINVTMIDFTPSSSPELCVETYAQAVKDRFGTIQYALMNEELRSKSRADFVGAYWVTGASSPWVEWYDINKTGDLSFDVTFHYASSTGMEGDSVVMITLKQSSDYYQIAAIN